MVWSLCRVHLVTVRAKWAFIPNLKFKNRVKLHRSQFIFPFAPLRLCVKFRQIRVHPWLKKAARDGGARRKNGKTARNPAIFPVTCRPSPVTFETFKNNSKKS
jgi:hypothetical protein